MITFKEMKYERPDLEAAKQQLAGITQRFVQAQDYPAAKQAFLDKDNLYKKIGTMNTLASIRHDINTKDEFYDAECRFWNSEMPKLQAYLNEFTKALLATPFREDFVKDYGDLMFVNGEIDMKAFSPELIPLMQKENLLAREYEDLLASAQVSFEGNTYTLSQMTPFKTDRDDARRLASVLKSAFRSTGAPIHVNLIRVNEVKETGFTAGSVDGANAFADILNSEGIVATVRRRLGSDVNAACGQLRRAAMKSKIDN